MSREYTGHFPDSLSVRFDGVNMPLASQKVVSITFFFFAEGALEYLDVCWTWMMIIHRLPFVFWIITMNPGCVTNHNSQDRIIPFEVILVRKFFETFFLCSFMGCVICRETVWHKIFCNLMSQWYGALLYYSFWHGGPTCGIFLHPNYHCHKLLSYGYELHSECNFYYWLLLYT